MSKQPCNCQAAYGCQYDDMKEQGRDGYYYCMAGRDAYEHHVAATTACPLCGSRDPHKHTPTEQVIYRNGLKAGRSQSDADPLDPAQTDGGDPSRCCPDCGLMFCRCSARDAATEQNNG